MSEQTATYKLKRWIYFNDTIRWIKEHLQWKIMTKANLIRLLTECVSATISNKDNIGERFWDTQKLYDKFLEKNNLK